MVNCNCLPNEMLTWFSICLNADAYDLQSICAHTFSYGLFCTTAAGFPLFLSCRVCSIEFLFMDHDFPSSPHNTVHQSWRSNPIKRRVACPQVCGQSVLEEWQHNKDYQLAFAISPAWSMWTRVMPAHSFGPSVGPLVFGEWSSTYTPVHTYTQKHERTHNVTKITMATCSSPRYVRWIKWLHPWSFRLIELTRHTFRWHRNWKPTFAISSTGFR